MTPVGEAELCSCWSMCIFIIVWPHLSNDLCFHLYHMKHYWKYGVCIYMYIIWLCFQSIQFQYWKDAGTNLLCIFNPNPNRWHTCSSTKSTITSFWLKVIYKTNSSIKTWKCIHVYTHLSFVPLEWLNVSNSMINFPSTVWLSCVKCHSVLQIIVIDKEKSCADIVTVGANPYVTFFPELICDYWGKGRQKYSHK